VTTLAGTGLVAADDVTTGAPDGTTDVTTGAAVTTGIGGGGGAVFVTTGAAARACPSAEIAEEDGPLVEGRTGGGVVE
jgi:hypothetical protein